MMDDMSGPIDADQGADTGITAHTAITTDLGITADLGITTDQGITAGAGIVRLDVIGTAAFAVSAGVSAIVFTNSLRIVGVVVALALFAIGVVAFLWSYWTAVQRSRVDNIAVAQLYFLSSGSTPKRVKLTMNLALLAQTIIGLGTAIARSTTDGRPGSTLAFGILVPMFGLGLNGLWCSKFGQFAPRRRPGDTGSPTSDVPDAVDSDDHAAADHTSDDHNSDVRTSDDEMEQNSTHG